MPTSGADYFLSPKNYTPYKFIAQYAEKLEDSTTTVELWINKFTHYFFDTITPNTAIPPGYVVAKGNNTLNLGPKVETHDWADLFRHYWGLLILIAILLALIIIVPFIAVCYCCFCCCRCNKEGCPPCNIEKNSRKRCYIGYFLALLIVGITFGVIIFLASNSSLELAIRRTAIDTHLATKDTCAYLREVSDHIHHLFVNNYEELCTQIISDLYDAPEKSYMGFLKEQKIDHYKVLNAKLENMPKALLVMDDVTSLIKDLRFYGAQLRDGLRTAKRDITYALTVLCGNSECLRFLSASRIESIDSSKCLHFDELPDPAKFSAAMRHIIKNGGVVYSTSRWESHDYWFLEAETEDCYEPMVNFIIEDLNAGKSLFRSRADRIRAIIDSIITEIHINSLSSTKMFQDVVTKFGGTRNAVSITVCWLLSTIIIFLIIGLICGCCGRHRRANRAGVCSKGIGSVFMFMAILLIFSVFSFIVLVGIFYLVIGLLTYQSACAPVRDQEGKSIFRYLDPEIDLNQFLPKSEDETPIPPVRVSNIIKRFQQNQSMCEVLQLSGLYDINELSKISIIEEHPMNDTDDNEFKYKNQNYFYEFENNRSDVFLTDNDMMEYNSSEFTVRICKELTPLDLMTLAKQLMALRSSLWSQWGIYDWARVTILTEVDDLRKLHNEIVLKVIGIVDEITRKLSHIDELILINKTFSYKDAVTNYVKDMNVSERYTWENIEKYYKDQRLRLPGWMRPFVTEYKQHVRNEFCTKVGNNAPIASIYNSGGDIACERLINPLNRCWVGLLLSSLLLLPVLFLAHRLMCLYKKIKPAAQTVQANKGTIKGLEICLCEMLNENNNNDRGTVTEE